jgi:hypothetical protein
VGGRFTKDAFDIDLEADTVSCPGGHTATIRRDDHGDGIARFGANCHVSVADRCTTAKAGRAITVSRHERLLAHARSDSKTPPGVPTTARPVPRSNASSRTCCVPGRRARRRGTAKVDADWNYLGAAINYARMARLGLRTIGGSWQIAPA